jgi:Histidine phosphatase superfamily (branch 2)
MIPRCFSTRRHLATPTLILLLHLSTTSRAQEGDENVGSDSYRAAAPELKQVHVITRHGSRRPLAKTAVTLEETSETSLLTSIGQQQHYQLGEWLRERYLEPFGDVLDQFDPVQVHMESSSYERTMVSANSLALGLFPRTTRGLQLIPDTPAVIPIYTNAGNNDITIRAYDKCPVYHDTLEQLYQTKTWHMMESEVMPLLTKLSLMPVFEEYVQHQMDTAYIPLKDIWNIYDAIHVAKTECTGVENMTAPEICNELPDASLATSINSMDWNDIQELAQGVELLKFGQDIAGNKLGGILLNTILKRMETSRLVLDDAKRLTSRFYVSSGHYPTILGLYSALSIPYHQEKVIPEYASALILELYRQGDSQYVQIFYKSGSSTEATPITVSQTCRTDQSQGCTLDQFAKEMEQNRLTDEEWCEACGNKDADVCLKMQVLWNTCSSSDDNNKWLLAAIYFAGTISAAAILMVWKPLCTRRGHLESKVADTVMMSQTTFFEEGNQHGNSTSLQSKTVGRDSRFDESVLA